MKNPRHYFRAIIFRILANGRRKMKKEVIRSARDVQLRIVKYNSL